ncbi:MAG TPA: aldehyde dehydrogenase family protein [Limnochordales bacterium]|nr:aldehyde dehydrogenase family protein [Limnochordales bacterium]
MATHHETRQDVPGDAPVLKSWIGGQWVEGSTGELYPDINPATGELLAQTSVAGAAEVDRAVRTAQAAFKDWRAMPAPRRGEILFRAAQLIAERKEDLARLMSREMGKVLFEARGEVQEAIDEFFYMAGEGRRLFGFTTPSEMPNKFACCVRDPVGVVGLITPWNFPVAVPSWKLAPALIAGNTIVWKPAEDTPMVALEFARLLEEAGIPPGVVNVVLGPGPQTGAPLVEHPGVRVIAFTGSTATGTLIATEGARRGKRVLLEMGGKNAITVMDDADLDLAVQGILWSAFGTSGQRCTAASRLIVHRKVIGELTERLVAGAQQLRLGNPLDETTQVGPIVNEKQLQRVHRYTGVGIEEGARLLCGGEIYREGDCAKGYFYRPTLFADVHPRMRIAQEEIFGPTAVIIPCDSLEEAIEINNDTPYGLSSSIYTRDVNRAMQAARDLTTGIVYINHGTTGAEVHLPFGGTRGTGNGHREAAVQALDAFTEWKSIYIDYSGRLQRAQIDTPSA